MNEEQQPLLQSGDRKHRIKSSSLGRRALLLRHHLRQPLAEFLGTFLIVFIGDGVVAQWVLSGGTHSSWLNVNIAWAGGVLLGSLVAGSISGAHLNPAVSICFALFPRNGSTFPLKKLPGYIIAQMLGGFVGAAVVFSEYWTQIESWEAGSRTIPGGSLISAGNGPTAGIFCTYPLPNSTMASSFFSELLASALLMLGIFIITSERNSPVSLSGHFSVFILLICIGSSVGWQSGYAINAARDLAPRLFTAIIYGREVFTVGDHYWWIPTISPIFGTILGASIYELFIGEPRGVIEGLLGSLPDDDEGELSI